MNRKQKQSIRKRVALAVLFGIAALMVTGLFAPKAHAGAQLFGPWASDSLNGASVVITDKIFCAGARAVHFYVRDSSVSNTSGMYVDSLAVSAIQVSNDGTNWNTITSPAANQYTPSDTSGCAMVGDLTNVSILPASNGGWKVVSLVPLPASDSGPVTIMRLVDGIPARYCRLRVVTKNDTGWGCGGSAACAGDRDMVGLRIRAVVIRGGDENAFILPTP